MGSGPLGSQGLGFRVQDVCRLRLGLLLAA